MFSVLSTFEKYSKLNKRMPAEMLVKVKTIEDPSELADTIVVHLTSVKLADRQEVLETVDPALRLEKLLELMNAEIEILLVEKKIRSRVKKQMEKSQKEYLLNEQMQAIRKELGERDEFKSEIEAFEKQMEEKALSEEAVERVKSEISKLKQMQPISAEAAVKRNYIEWVLSLPWGQETEENYDIDHAEAVLDEDHYGLKKPKERILEYLAVQALVQKLQGPVLCLAGPPGVGKTSLARSIARATGREFVRLSLGGVRDESEIRGHRRTYIGAMPGRLVQSLKKVGTDNPVMLLDEIDKMTRDMRGDPSAALLEVLDPEQNNTFSDRFIDLDYDLSKVMFITTANDLGSIPGPLRDRMEILRLSGYTEYEKLNIAVRYLVPRQLKAAGLEEVDVDITENAIRTLIHYYTLESGVRNLEREIGSVCRKLARRVLKEGRDQTYRIAARNIPELLGVPKVLPDRKSDKDEVGLTHGLSVNYGITGSILECEAIVIPGKGKVKVTGMLQKMMEESAGAAMSYIRSRHHLLGLEEDFHSNVDVHVHFPGGDGKDGNSAGVTMATSIASALTKIPVRTNVAMTGEITLRGRVGAIGGLKEKTLAAHRARIDTLIIPSENRKDLREIPRRVLEGLRIVLVDHMDEVLAEALALSDPDALFGPDRTKPPEYRHGKLIEHPPEGTKAPTAPGSETPQ